MEKLHDGHLRAKSKDEKDKVVVDGAKIHCSYAKEITTGKDLYVNLRIPCSHGLLQNDHLCAHEKNCVPIENIPPFFYCISPFYENMLNYINAWDSQGPNIQYAIQSYKQGESYRPCLLPLLDRWMNVSEKAISENYFKIVLEYDFEPLWNKLKYFCEDTRKKAWDVFKHRIEISYGYSEDLEHVIKDENAETDYYYEMEKLKNIEEVQEKIKLLLKDDKFFVFGTDYEYVVHHTKEILDALQEIKEYTIDVQQKVFVDREHYLKQEQVLNQAIEQVNEVYQSASKFKPEATHWVTMESYLICRGGGVLSFYTSGQEYYEYCQFWIVETLNLVNALIDDCHDRLLTKRRKFFEYTRTGIDVEGYSYQKAIEFLENYKEVMYSDEISIEELKAPIYIEFVSHAYKEEVHRNVSNIIGIIMPFTGLVVVPVLIGMVNLKEAIEGGDLLSGIVEGISLDEAVGGKIDPNLGKIVYKVNTIGSLIMTIISFFMQSNEEWIEEIKLTVYCNNTEEIGLKDYSGDYDMVHTAYCKYDEKGTKVGEYVYNVGKKRDYIANGWEWNITPAAWFIYKKHVLDQEKVKDRKMDGIKDVFNPR